MGGGGGAFSASDDVGCVPFSAVMKSMVNRFGLIIFRKGSVVLSENR